MCLFKIVDVEKCFRHMQQVFIIVAVDKRFVVVYWMICLFVCLFGMLDCNLAIQASSGLSLMLIFPLIDVSWK